MFLPAHNEFIFLCGLPWCLSGKESTHSAGDIGDVVHSLGCKNSPGGGNGNPLQYSFQ